MGAPSFPRVSAPRAATCGGVRGEQRVPTNSQPPAGYLCGLHLPCPESKGVRPVPCGACGAEARLALSQRRVPRELSRARSLGCGEERMPQALPLCPPGVFASGQECLGVI